MIIKIHLAILVLGIFFSISIEEIFADSDFILELKNVSTIPIISKLEIDGENIQQLCPTGKCELEFINSSFIPPKPNNMTIAHTINFNFKYNSTNSNINGIEKEYPEKFYESMNSCLIYDVIKEKEQEIYFCNDGTNSMKRNSDSILVLRFYWNL